MQHRPGRIGVEHLAIIPAKTFIGQLYTHQISHDIFTRGKANTNLRHFIFIMSLHFAEHTETFLGIQDNPIESLYTAEVARHYRGRD